MQTFSPLEPSSIGISLDDDDIDSINNWLPPQTDDKILCIVFAKSKLSSKSVKLTWGSQCNSIHFYGYSNFNDSSIPVIKISRSNLISFSEFCSIVFDLADDFHWILMAHDDTYVIVENLRRLLYKFNHTDLVYLGRPSRAYAQLPYNSRESGIVLSKKAFNFIKESVTNLSICKSLHLPSIGTIDRRSDIALAMILKQANCTPIDTRDQFGRARFLALSPERHMSPDKSGVLGPFWRFNIHPILQGPLCCSKSLITMPRVSSTRVYFFHYLLHNVNIK